MLLKFWIKRLEKLREGKKRNKKKNNDFFEKVVNHEIYHIFYLHFNHLLQSLQIFYCYSDRDVSLDRLGRGGKTKRRKNECIYV